jgi:hypothetical protein
MTSLVLSIFYKLDCPVISLAAFEKQVLQLQYFRYSDVMEVCSEVFTGTSTAKTNLM